MTESNAISLQTVHEVRDTCLCFCAQRLARRLARRFDLAFQPFGITNGQFSLMMVLAGPSQLQMHHIADFLAMDRTTLTAALKALERRGLAISLRNDKDKRGRYPALTDAGRAILQEAVPVWRAEHRRLDAEFGVEEAGRLRAVLGLVA